MYFQIENTPEHIRRAQKTVKPKKESPKEECPRLVLAPFSKPPQVVFDNVLIGSTCERNLEVYNPLKQCQQLMLGKAPPPGLIIHLPGECLTVEPQTCYCLSMSWTPIQPTAVRENIRFTNDGIGRFDVIVVLKSSMNIKGKSKQVKGYKTSPGKMKTKIIGKKSPVSLYKKKSEIIYNSTKVKKSINIVQSTQYETKIYQTHKENVMSNDYSIDSYREYNKCPFDSPTSIDMHFNTSEVFSNMRNTNILQNTYDKPYDITHDKLNEDKSYVVNNDKLGVPHNILKPSNKQVFETTATDIFDNLTFTPLKPSKTDKLDKGPRIILSVNSESEFDDSLDMKTSNKENETHSIISITSAQPPNKWLTVNHHVDHQLNETPQLHIKKHPDTSSPKEFNSPNFSINTDFSRISELSFMPQRFSTERKCFPHDIPDDIKLNSDTYTKDSPNTPMERVYPGNDRPPHYFNREPKVCRQALFREYQLQKEVSEKNYLNPYDQNVWQNDPRFDRSPPRSIEEGPLQSIPEETTQFSETQILDKTDKQTFTINRTFDKTHDRSRQTWSKKAIKAEPELWKIPVSQPKKSLKPKIKDSIGSKISNTTFDGNKTNQNITLNQFGNVYSQSSTVDPFLSSTYFYDEEAVEKFETEFKRWLNCVLTPPADLDSNAEMTIDVGKAWIENRNKEVPLAPTKEQVSSMYHNSHRLESLRRSAKSLLMSPEIAQVFQKLNAQIEKKLIAIRTDRNLHLDVGLQKAIMELLLSYNPLWLRIGLEAIYGLVLPLKSNNDIEGLTTFIIQRMFKNPHLKNKHSKSSAPNMLLPAYMEAIKKFTLKKFFMLVFFLDQAKQRKIISHDPCLFCRNAICKESREIIIRFTRDLIAGIGDITKHLRPLGYVVSHKQSYLDEYKYAVHNIALDIRDGVRLTRVMEIILMKKGLLNQLRTPPISRLQKIHNVQVALNALKEANFVIVGDIAAVDIADGHREKTLSLLWQLIHVFRAPLFEKAANIIQTWWRKKYEVIAEKRKEAERLRQKLNNAASIIQYWWQRIQYNRQVELQMQTVTRATIVVQKYCRMWLCRTRLRKLKYSVLKIEQWYCSIKIMRKAKDTLQKLRQEREELQNKSAIVIQRQVRRLLCMRQYRITVQKIVKIQSIIRKNLERKHYLQLKKTALFIGQIYKGKLVMRQEMNTFAKQKQSAIVVQSHYRMLKQRRNYLQMKKSVRILEERYYALLQMRRDRNKYLTIKRASTTIQTYYRAYIIGKKQRREFIRIKTATTLIQRFYRSYITTKNIMREFIKIKTSTIKIQRFYRSYLETKKQRKAYLKMKSAVSYIENYYKRYKEYQNIRQNYMQLRQVVIMVQRRYRSTVAMKLQRTEYLQLKETVKNIQIKYRAKIAMRKERKSYLTLRSAVLTIQRRYRSNLAMKRERHLYLTNKKAAFYIQNWYRSYKLMSKHKREYFQLKETVKKIQIKYRALLAMRKERQSYLTLRSAVLTVQSRYRANLAMKRERNLYLTKKKAAATIQNWYRSYKLMSKHKREYSSIVNACKIIQNRYRARLSGRKQHEQYLKLKSAVVTIQTYYRMMIQTRIIRTNYLKLKKTVIYVQRRFRANKKANQCRQDYLQMRRKVVTIQSIIRMYTCRQRFIKLRNATLTIQNYYRSYNLTLKQRQNYLLTRSYIIKIQSYVRCYIQKKRYLKLRASTLIIQAIFRLSRHRAIVKKQRQAAALCIQKNYRQYVTQKSYLDILKKIITVQQRWRGLLLMRLARCEFLQKKRTVIKLQSIARGYLVRKQIQIKKAEIVKIREENRRHWAASKIQALFRGHKARVRTANDKRVVELRRRWRDGALESTQESMKDRNKEVLGVLKNMTNIPTVIRAFRSLELLTEVFPMMYNMNASPIVRVVYTYMSVTNRSTSSIDVLKSAAAILVNLTRYKITGPKIYERDRISNVLKFMLRFSTSETHLFCMLCTYIWLFSKYENIREDLTEYLQTQENHKMLKSIKGNVDRMKKMANNYSRNKFSTPQPCKYVSHFNHSMNFSRFSVCNSSNSVILPSLEPDFGIVRVDKPRYFEDPQQAIDCLFETYNL